MLYGENFIAAQTLFLMRYGGHRTTATLASAEVSKPGGNHGLLLTRPRVNCGYCGPWAILAPSIITAAAAAAGWLGNPLPCCSGKYLASMVTLENKDGECTRQFQDIVGRVSNRPYFHVFEVRRLLYMR